MNSLKKGPSRIGIGLKCIFITQLFKASSLNKNRLITLIVRVLGRVEKNA